MSQGLDSPFCNRHPLRGTPTVQGSRICPVTDAPLGRPPHSTLDNLQCRVYNSTAWLNIMEYHSGAWTDPRTSDIERVPLEPLNRSCVCRKLPAGDTTITS